MMMNMLAHNVKLLRMSKKMTQQDLADAVGYLHKTSISKIEKGKIDLPLSMVSKLSEVLGVDEKRLLFGINDNLAPHEYEVINSYRNQSSDVQNAIDRMLGIEKKSGESSIKVG